MKTYIIAKKESKSIFIHLTCFLKQKLNFLYNNRITRLSIDIILLFFFYEKLYILCYICI